jgi:hypothetical protein
MAGTSMSARADAMSSWLVDSGQASFVGPYHCLAHRERHIQRHRWRRRDEDHAHQPARSPACDQLRDLAAHRMSNQDVSLQIEGADHGLRIIGEVGQRIASGGSRRLAPAALIERDSAEVGHQAIDDMPPST